MSTAGCMPCHSLIRKLFLQKHVHYQCIIKP